MKKSLSKKICFALLAATFISSGAFASDTTQGVDTHTTCKDGYLYYDSSADRWYTVLSDGTVWDSVDGKYLRNNAVTKVTDGIAQESKDRAAAISAESQAQINADTNLSNQIDDILNNGVTYLDDTHSAVSLSSNGTKITNLSAGTVESGSTDAITGAQLFERKQDIDQVTAERKKAMQAETVARQVADDAINSKIGSLTGKGSNYLNNTASLSSNLSRLDKVAADTADKFEQDKAKSDKDINALIARREASDAELDAEIGKIDNGYSSHFIKKNNSLSDNLIILDQTINPLKDKLAEESEKNAHAFDNEIVERNKADQELMDRIGTFSDTANLVYINKDASVSKNLVTLDQENKKTADAIQQEIQNRKQQFSNVAEKTLGRIQGMKQEVAAIGASGAALSALEYDNYDSKSKWSFSAAQGSYRSKNESAVGIRYYFGKDSSIQLATSLGQCKNLWGGSVTVRPGTPSLQREISPEIKELMEINQLAHKTHAQKAAIESALFVNDDTEKEESHVKF